MGCTTNQRNILFECLLQLLVQGSGSSGSSSVFSGVIIVEEVGGVEDGVRGCFNSWYTDTLGGLYEHVPQIFLFHWWSFFLVKNKISGLGTALFKCQIIRWWIKGILLYLPLRLVYSIFSRRYQSVHGGTFKKHHVWRKCLSHSLSYLFVVPCIVDIQNTRPT